MVLKIKISLEIIQCILNSYSYTSLNWMVYNVPFTMLPNYYISYVSLRRSLDVDIILFVVVTNSSSNCGCYADNIYISNIEPLMAANNTKILFVIY